MVALAVGVLVLGPIDGAEAAKYHHMPTIMSLSAHQLSPY
jgi:hypothetical protein